VDVAAIVVTHQSAGFLGPCLDSLEASRGDLDLTVVVSDSASTDATEDMCRERGVPFLAGPNRGFGAAVNRVLSHEGVRDARWLLVMNPDLEIAEGSLEGFVALCEERPDSGIFAPRQVDQHGELVPSIGIEPTPAHYWSTWQTAWPNWDWDKASYEREARCEWVMGAFMLIRRAAFEQLGGFDERFFLYSEEVDLCTRARLTGWGIAYLPQLTITHWKADRPFDPHRLRLQIWAMLVYIRKWYGRREQASMRLALVARLARQLMRRLFRGQDARRDWVRLTAALIFRPRRYGPQ
jgi:GT2 family glycosyltransferase